MATTSRRKDAPLIERLKDRAFEFQFAQAVRVLECAAARSLQDRHAGVGVDAHPNDEIVHFRAHQSLAFPPGEIAALTNRETNPSQAVSQTKALRSEPLPRSADTDNGKTEVVVESEIEFHAETVDADAGPYDMSVTFFGLTGPSGVLPHHYTTTLLKQLRNREEAMRDFLDIFNHRLISLFYRAIAKHDVPLVFERSRREGVDHDALTQILFALIGMGTDDLRGRLAVHDENLLYFSGHFSRSPRSVVALEKLIREYFHVDCRILQFQGQWLRLDAGDRSLMPSRDLPEGRNARIGVDTIMGSAVWDVQSRFRVQIGPLDLKRFIEFTPARPTLRELCELIRLYVGMEYDFDVQPVLRREDVPMSQMGGDPGAGSHLGWTSWMTTEPATEDFVGAVFSLEDV